MTTDVRAGEANDALTRALIDAAARGIRPRCGGGRHGVGRLSR
jgi:hypothetical protein